MKPNNIVESAFDFFGNAVKVGDFVAFPNGNEMMLGVVEKIRRTSKYVLREEPCYEFFVKNASGYKKWKETNAIIKKECK